MVALGGMWLVAPARLFAGMGVTLAGVSATHEMRASGGLHLALGLFYLAGALHGSLRRAALLTLAVHAGGLVAGRLVSTVVDGSPELKLWGIFAADVACSPSPS
jgi:uncharacterized protein DUF4345